MVRRYRPRHIGLRGQSMKKNYDFSRGRRGALVPTPPGKTRITIRLDDDLLDWFRDQVDAAGGGNYQTLINTALRQYVEQQRESMETTVRRVVREEFSRYRASTKKGLGSRATRARASSASR